jgi:hypothetical protein
MELAFLSSMAAGILSLLLALRGIGSDTDAATTIAAVAILSDLIFIFFSYWCLLDAKNAAHRQTLHVPPPFAQWPQYLQLVQAVQVPFGLHRPARQSEADDTAIAKIRARDFIHVFF